MADSRKLPEDNHSKGGSPSLTTKPGEPNPKARLAQNLIDFCRAGEGQASMFTLEEYERFFAPREISPEEKEFLEYMVGWGALICNAGIYSCTDKFANILGKYLQPKKEQA